MVLNDPNNHLYLNGMPHRFCILYAFTYTWNKHKFQSAHPLENLSPRLCTNPIELQVHQYIGRHHYSRIQTHLRLNPNHEPHHHTQWQSSEAQSELLQVEPTNRLSCLVLPYTLETADSHSRCLVSLTASYLQLAHKSPNVEPVKRPTDFSAHTPTGHNTLAPRDPPEPFYPLQLASNNVENRRSVGCSATVTITGNTSMRGWIQAPNSIRYNPISPPISSPISLTIAYGEPLVPDKRAGEFLGYLTDNGST